MIAEPKRALLVSPTDAANLVASGSGPQGPGAWAGRGCSALASALQTSGFEDAPFTDIDFSTNVALVVAGADRSSIALDLANSAVSAVAGGDWAIFAVPWAGLPAALKLQVGASVANLEIETGPPVQ